MHKAFVCMREWILWLRMRTLKHLVIDREDVNKEQRRWLMGKQPM